MIRAEELTKDFGGVRAVDRVSLHIEDGEIFGLVGPDGAGKTTLIRMMLGIIAMTSGTVRVMDSASIESVKEHLGYIPQRFSLYGDLTVMENIRTMGALYGSSAADVEERGRYILDFTGLLPFVDRLADNLSGGMKQKLALAAGLMHKPRIFFLDEPTTGVDPVSRREFWQMLYRLNKEGMTVVVSTPYMDEAELCTRVAFMNDGRIAACDRVEKLKKSYPFALLELTATVNIREALKKCTAENINVFGKRYHLAVRDATVARVELEALLAAAGVTDYEIREVMPQLEDVFVHLAGEGASDEFSGFDR